MISRDEMIRKIRREGCVDTSMYRYIIHEYDGVVVRKERSRLGPVGAHEPWEIVWKLRPEEAAWPTIVRCKDCAIVNICRFHDILGDIGFCSQGRIE